MRRGGFQRKEGPFEEKADRIKDRTTQQTKIREKGGGTRSILNIDTEENRRNTSRMTGEYIERTWKSFVGEANYFAVKVGEGVGRYGQPIF